MVVLIPAIDVAVRAKFFETGNYSNWHLRSKKNENKTVCGEITHGLHEWEEEHISEIKTTKKWCAICTAALTVEKNNDTIRQLKLF